MAKPRAAKKKAKEKTGRKLAPIDPIEVEKLSEIGATNIEIADFFNVDESVIRKRFPEILTKGRASGKTRLRRFQWDSAKNGSVPMMIWLGKQMLGQTDRVDTTTDGEAIKPIELIVNNKATKKAFEDAIKQH